MGPERARSSRLRCGPDRLLREQIEAPWAAVASCTVESADDALKPRPDRQECHVKALEGAQGRRPTRDQSERPEQRNRAPHGSKGRGARQHTTVLARVELSHEVAARQRAGGVLWRDVPKVDRAGSVETPHQGDLPPTQRTAPVEPNYDRTHQHHMGSRAPVATPGSCEPQALAGCPRTSSATMAPS